IVNEIINQQESNAAYKNIKLTSSVDEDLEVYADPDMILVILRNLIANSLKFTTEGGKVEVIAQEEDDMVKVSVRDNGIGMSEEIRHKIFDKDESVTTLGTSNEKGTGLGISLCKDFVQKNNGTLRADSTPGEGTTISFTLPVAQEMESYSDVLTQAS
ncbi:MAG: HAMP domain-containing sensor histidine kinase, partial [Balneolaceae bacterium]|nr:HAMP domain-containing sensor histidine kinase [Balneolaceae bacterium]